MDLAQQVHQWNNSPIAQKYGLAMKRSEINRFQQEAVGFFQRHNFYLPKWAFWSKETWQMKGDVAWEIVEKNLIGTLLILALGILKNKAYFFLQFAMGNLARKIPNPILKKL